MAKGKIRSQAILKSHSSQVHEKEEPILSPLDSLSIQITSLRLVSEDRGVHTVAVMYFDLLLFKGMVTPIGPKDPEEKQSLYDSSGVILFDPSNYPRMSSFADHSLIVRVQPMDDSTTTSCCNIDILPLLQGETEMRFSKRLEPMNEPTALQIQSWVNLPLITIEVKIERNPQNQIHHKVLNGANLMKVTVIAAYNVIEPYNETNSYIVASKIGLSSEENKESSSMYQQGLPYSKRFSVCEFYPSWESIESGDVFRKCEEKMSFSLDSVQNTENINLSQYIENKDQTYTVVWGSFHRALMLASEEHTLKRHLRQYKWPVEFHMLRNNGGDGYSFMGFLDLFQLLYPGESTVRVCVPLYWANSAVMMEKCGCEPLIPYQEKAQMTSLMGSEPNTIKHETATTSASVVVEEPSAPASTGADDNNAFLIVEVRLARPLVKINIPPFITDSDIKSMLRKKSYWKKDVRDKRTCTGRGQLANEWQDTVMRAASALQKVPYFGVTDFCAFNRSLNRTSVRVELTTSFWQDAAIYINNNFVVQDYLNSDIAFEELLMISHRCLMLEVTKTLTGNEPERDNTWRAARAARQHQDVKHATQLFLKLVAENENNENSWRELATCMMDEDVHLARVCINEALLLNPRHPLTLLSKASMLYEKDSESAEIFFTAILALYPYWSTGWVIAQAYYTERQEFNMADRIRKLMLQTLNQGLAEDLAPDRGWGNELGDWWYPTPLLPGMSHYFDAADLLLRLRGLPLAEVCLGRALLAHGEAPAYSHMVALACRLRGDIENAMCHLQGAFEAFGEVNYLRSLEAECLSKMNNRNAALTSLEKSGNCLNSFGILNLLPCRDPLRTRDTVVDLLRRQPSAYAWMALADDWLMRQAATGQSAGDGDAAMEVAMTAWCAEACAEQALKWDRACARAWVLLASLAKPKARRIYCANMAANLGYQSTDLLLVDCGPSQSICYILGQPVKECICSHPDAEREECEGICTCHA